ncbi:MAG: serine hydrolase domain-containing protein [Actinomycetota bacterium]
MKIDRDLVEAAISTAQERITSIVNSRVDDQAVPGLVAAIFFEGEILYFQAAGERELGGPTPDVHTAFRVASCTKSFTAASVLLLRDRGLLTLDDPITKYVPRYSQAGPLSHCSPPTLRMLLTMSAGFGTDDPWADREESITPDELESHVENGVYLVSVPGAQYEYSNLGYALLGHVIELVTNESFPTFVHQEFFVPLGLKDSSFSLASSRATSVATGYRRRGSEWLPQEFASPGSFSSIGGAFSSARDLATWASWLATALKPEAAESGPLSLASRREMQQLHVPMPFSNGAATTAETSGRLFGYGFALHVDFDKEMGKFISHSGGYPGYSAHMRWHENSGVGVVVLENARYSGAWATATNVLESVLPTLSHLSHTSDSDILNEFVRRTSSLLFTWNDKLANELFAPNVALDIPYPERISEISDLCKKVGGLQAVEEFEIETNDSPLHARWSIPGQTENLLCEIRLTPVLPLKIQAFRISVA